MAMQKFKKIVIGGGISGLSFAFYHRDSVVITPDGEKKDSPFVFIQENSYTTKLIYDLNLEANTEDVMVYPKESDDVISDKVGGISSFFVGTDKIANIGEGFILKALSIRESDVVNMLRKAVKDRVIKDKVIRIDGNIVFTESGEQYQYDELISTMHFKEFEKVFGGWECGEDVKLVKMFIDEVDDPSVSKNKISYNCAKGVKKMVENKITKSIGYEMTENKGTCKEMSRFTGRLNPAPKNVIFLGRFATANSHWRIEDSIFIAQQGYMLAKMLTEQRRFDRAVDYANKVAATDRCKDLVLHVHSEASELLRELNWKTHRKEGKIVKATSILEEGIDIIKLVFGILNMFLYTEREIYEMFYEKTRIVWSKFLTDFYGNV
jgi:hypothetical protein